MTTEAKATLLDLVEAIEAGPVRDDQGSIVCGACGDGYHLNSGDDPTALCHECAQKAADHLPELLHDLLALAHRVSEHFPGLDAPLGIAAREIIAKVNGSDHAV